MLKKICLLIALGFSEFVQAQDAHPFNLTFNHIALSVKDIEREVEFYGKVLRLTEIENKTKEGGRRWFSLGEGKELHLLPTPTDHIVISKSVHMALTTPDFDALVTALDIKGIVYSDWPGTPHKINLRADGIRQIFFQDPEGYWIEVNSVVKR